MHVNNSTINHFHTHRNFSGRHIPLDYGNEGFMVFGTSLLWLLVPGCGFFYAGMARSKSALSMMTMSLWSIAVVSVQWFICGYSLAFSLTSRNSFVGDFGRAFYIGVSGGAYPPAERISEISFSFYQGVTATLPAALISGALAERARIMPALIFIFLWSTLVYCPCAFWSLNPNGWSYKIGILDFGGGAPVHVPASVAALVYCYFLGPRPDADIHAKPHNMGCIVIGTVLFWFGSFGYNSGSGKEMRIEAYGATLQAVFSCFVTNLSGSVGALTWALQDYLYDGKCNAFGFCVGSVIGLIVITPASGFVHPICAFPISICGTVVCRWGYHLKRRWNLLMAFDDTLDVFATHGLAGIMGILLTGIFAQHAYGAGEDEGDIGGWLDGNYMQIFVQIADTVAGFTWSSLVSCILLWTMNRIPGLRLRLDDLHVIEGMDLDQMGITCYEHIEDIRLTIDTAVWKITPEVKVKMPPELIMSQTAVTIQTNNGNHHKPNNRQNNSQSLLSENVLNERNEDFVPTTTWQNYWY